MNLKEALLNRCQAIVEEKLTKLRHSVKNIQESLNSETKSTAGDKHETGRAMLQLEREKLGQQLSETQKLNETLSKIDTQNISDNVRLGSIVYTNGANYFLAISVGEISLEEGKFYAISPKTPIGAKLLGKTTGDIIDFRENFIEIVKVL